MITKCKRKFMLSKGHVIAQSSSHYFYITHRNINLHHSQSFLLSPCNSLLNRDCVQEWHHNTKFCSRILMSHKLYSILVRVAFYVTWVMGPLYFWNFVL